MISASHRKRDSREALVRWLRDRSSGGRTSHSGTFDCRSPILDCTPFPRFLIESRQSKSPKILAGNILQRFSVAGARRGLNRIRLQPAIHFCLHRGSLSEKTTRRQPRFRRKTPPLKFRRILYVITNRPSSRHRRTRVRRRTRTRRRAVPRKKFTALSDSDIVDAPAFTGDANVSSHPPAQYNIDNAPVREIHHHGVDKSARIAGPCLPTSQGIATATVDRAV